MTSIEYMEKIREQRKVFEDYKKYKKTLIPQLIVINTPEAWKRAKEQYRGNKK